MNCFIRFPCVVPVLFLLVLLRGLSVAEEVNEKAQRYYESLLRRPAPGAVFDRFYTAWLDTRTVDEVEAWLKEKAGAADAPPAARLLLAFFYARQNENVKAIAQFKLAVEKDAGNTEAWYQKALVEARTLDFDGALASLAKAAETNPPAAMLNQIRQMQGRWLARNGKTEEAVKVWQALIEARPDDEELREDLIELQITEGLHEQALTTAQALLEKTQDAYRKVQRRMRIGDIHQRSGNRDKAIETYLLCLDETGADSWLEKEILSQVEQTFRKDDAMDTLKEEFKKLAAKYPQRVSLRRQFAKLLAETGETDEAVAEFTKILELTPGSRELREAFVDLLVQAKKAKEATAQMQELIRLNPADIEMLVKLADIYFELQQPDDCRRTVDEFLAKSDQSEASWLRAAGMLERFKLPDASLEMCRKTAEKFAGSEAAQDALVVALHKSGKKDEAQAVWRKLAEAGSKARVMSVARSAAAREEHGLAYELLTARMEEFGKDPLFLLQLCDTAQRVEKFAEAVPWARSLVVMSKDAMELEGSLTLLMRLAGKAEQLDTMLAELKSAAPSPQEKCLLAELLDNSGDPKASEAVLRDVENAEPELAAAVLVRLQIQRGDPAGAAESMKRLVESPGGRKGAHVQRLVELYERAGKAKDALTWIPEWKKLSPGSNLPWQKEAALHFQAGNNKEALRSLRQAAQEFEDNDDLKALLADAFADDGKLADAERLYTVLYEDAKELSDKIRWAGKLAEVAKTAGKTADLIEMFEERRKANRTSLLPLLALAEIYRVSENYEGRRRALLEAARLKENDLDLLLEVARIEEAEEDYPHALETLKKAEPLDKTGRVRQRIARLHFKSGDEERGMSSLRQIADGKFDPRLAEALAESLCDQELWPQAAEFLQPLLAQNPDDYRLHYLSAIALEEGTQVKVAARAFQHLLTLRKELPSTKGASSLPALPPYRDYMEAMRPFLPAETLEIVRIGNISWQAYYHRQNRGRSGGQQPIRMPGSVDDSRAMSLVHLASMAQDLNDSEKAALAADIRAQGIKSADLLMEMVQGERMNQQLDFETLLVKSPDDEVLLSLAALWGGRRNPNQTGTALDLKIYGKLKPNRPELSWLAGLRLGKSEEAGALDAYTETVNAVEKLENPPLLVMNAAIESLGALENNGETMPEESRTISNRLRAKLPGWYRRADPKSSQAQYAFINIATQLAREQDLAPFVQLFEEEIAASAEDPNRSARNLYFARRNNALLEALQFPPQRLADYSLPVLGMLNGGADNYYGRRMELDPEKLKAAIPSVKDPVLRVLLTARSEDEEATAKLLTEMTAQPEPSLNAFLLHAAWLSSQEKFAEAGALLRRAQYLPMTKEIRRLVDSSQINWAIEAGEAGALAEDSPLLAAGREAVLRMRRDALSPAHRGELAGCMEQLGLTKEAERLAAGAPVTTPSPGASRTASLTMRSRAGAAGGGRIEQLIQKGKRDEAFKELSRQLKSYTKMWLAGTGDVRYQTRDWMEIVSRHGFNRQLLESVQPAAGAPPESVIQWAAAQDILGETRKALESYRKALELKPKDTGLRQAYMMTLVTDNPAKAAEELKTYDPALVLSLGSSLSNIMNRAETNAARLALLEFFLTMLEKIPADERAKTNAEPLLKSVEFAVQSSWGNNEQDIGSLYHLRGRETPDEGAAKSAQPTKEKRRELHQNIMRLLMQSPGTARRAFELYAGVALATDAKAAEPELDRMALEALETEVKVRARNSVVLPGQRNLHGRSGETPIRMPDPETHLIERAWAQQRPELITDDLLPRLKRSSRSAQGKKIEESLPLYFCKDAEFGEAVAAYLKKHARSTPPGAVPEHWMSVLHVMELRKLDLDLTDAIIESLKNNSGNYYGGSEFAHVVAYAQHMHKARSPEAVRTLLRRVAEYALGPKEKRADLIAKHFNPNSYSSNTPNGMIMHWIQFLRTLWNHENLILAAAESYTRDFLYYGRDHVQQDQLFQYSHRLDDSSFFQRDASAVVEFFRGSRLTAPLADFMAFSSPLSQKCLTADILKAMGNADKKKLREAFGKEPRTFGTELIDLAFEKENVTQAVLLKVAAHLDEIKKLEPPQQQDIAGMIQVTTSWTTLPESKMTDAMRGAKQWAEDVALGGPADRVAKILALKSLRGSQNLADYQFSQSLTPLLISLVKSNPDEAVKVFLKARSLITEARKSGLNSSVSYGDNSSMMGGVLFAVVSGIPRGREGSHGHMGNLLGFVLRSSLTPDGFPVEWKPGVLDFMSNALRALGTPEGEADKPDGKKAEPKFSIRELLPRLAKVPGMHSGAMLGAGRALFAGKRTIINDEDLKWLEEQATAGESKELASALLAGFRFSDKDAKRQNVIDAGALPMEQKRLLEFINDSAVPATVRLSVTGEIFETFAAIEAPVRYGAVSLLGTAWQQKVPIVEKHSNSIVAALAALHPDLSAPPTEPFRAAAAELLKGWQRVAATRSSGGNYGFQFSSSDGLSTAGAFSLALATGDEGLIKQFLNTGASHANRTVLIALVKAKRFEIAQMIVRMGADAIYHEPEKSEDSSWTPALAGAVKEFTGGFQSEDEKYLGELLITSLPDSKQVTEGDLKGKAPLRAERLREIAARMPEKFSNPLVQERVLAMLISAETSLPALETSLAAWAAHQTFGTVSVLEDQNQRQRRSMLFTEHLKRRLAAGDLAPVKEVMVQIAGAAGGQRNSYQVREAARPMLTLWQNESAALIASSDAAVRATARDIWRELAFARDSDNSLEGLSPHRALRALLYDALEDRVADFSTAAAELPEATRKKLVRELEAATVDSLEQFKTRWPDNKEEAAKAKSRTTLRMMRNTVAWLVELPGDPRTLRTLIERGWLLRDDVMAEAPALMERHPRMGRTAQEFAGLYAGAGRPQEAIAALDKAAALMADADKFAMARFALTRAGVLETLDRTEEALAALDAISAETLEAKEAGPGLKPQVTAARIRIEQAVAWHKGGAEAVIAIAAKRVEADPAANGPRKAVADGFSLIAGKLEADGEKAAAWHYRAAAFLILQKLAAADAGNYAEEFSRAGKSLSAARADAGGMTPFDAVGRNAIWRYFEGVQDFKSWMSAEHDDSAWKSGESPLGTGVEDGIIRTQTLIPVVMGFRTKFSLKNPEVVQSMVLELMRGDGAAVYLNGKEIHRSNLPEGELSEGTRAQNMVSHAEAVQWRPVRIARAALPELKAQNVLAVVLFQHDDTSTGLTFGASLRVNDFEPWELAKSIDTEAMQKALANVWTQLPEAFRQEMIETEPRTPPSKP